MTNEDGKVIIHYEYDAFGSIVYQDGSLENSYQYQTKEYDSQSGLVYFGARYYDPSIGRFTTPDPLGMVDGPNVYVYLNNNPIGFVDPWGLCGEEDDLQEIREYWKTVGYGFATKDWEPFRQSWENRLAEIEKNPLDFAMQIAIGFSGGINPIKGGQGAINAATRSLAREAKLLKYSNDMIEIVIQPGRESKWLKLIRIILTEGKELPKTEIKVPGL